MSYFNTILIVLLFWSGGVDGIYQKNKLVEKAQSALEEAQSALINVRSALNAKDKAKATAYRKEAKEHYRTAKEYYSRLVADFGVQDEEVKLNLAHTYFYLEQEQAAENQKQQAELPEGQKFTPFKVAKKYYSDLSLSQNKRISSTAYAQLGIIESAAATDVKSANAALENFKEALKKNPDNDLARYNYEVLIRQKAQQQSQSDGKNSEDEQKEEEQKQKPKKEEQKQQDEKKEGQKSKAQQAEQDKNSKASRDAMLRAIERKPIDYPKIQRFKPKNKDKKTKEW